MKIRIRNINQSQKTRTDFRTALIFILGGVWGSMGSFLIGAWETLASFSIIYLIFATIYLVENNKLKKEERTEWPRY